MVEDRKIKALEAAQEFIKYLAALAVGALGFALAGLTPTTRDSTLSVSLLIAAAVLLAGSVFMGILAHGASVSQLDDGQIDLEERHLAWPARGQWILFLAGIVILGAAIFVRDVIRAPQHPVVNEHIFPF